MLTTILLLLLLAHPLPASGQQQPPFILELSSQGSDPYRDLLGAFETHFSGFFPDTHYSYHLIPPEAEGNSLPFSPEEMPHRPSVILVLGKKALEIARVSFPGIPLVVSMVLDDVAANPQEPFISISLQIAPATQLSWLAKFLPDIQKVGILYDPERSSTLIRKFQESSREAGIEIIPVEVNSIKQLQAGLQYISTHADALLAIPDPTVYSGKTAQEVLLFTYRNRVPFVGLSSTWVKAGALYSLEANYPDIGRKCAESARHLLSERPFTAPLFLSEETVTYTINAKTAQYLRIDLDPSLVAGGEEIFQ